MCRHDVFAVNASETFLIDLNRHVLDSKVVEKSCETGKHMYGSYYLLSLSTVSFGNVLFVCLFS